MTPAFPERVELANSLRGALRALRWGGARYAVAGAIALGSVLAFAAGSAFGTAAFLDAASAALPQLPEVSPAFLVERLLHASFLSAGFLLLLGALTTGVSTLFLSAELPALLVLPIPHARIFRRQLLQTVAASSAPMLLLALPVLGVAAVRAPRPVLAFGAGLAGLSAVALAAGVTGSAGALLLVRLVPPRRALILSAFVSAIGLSSALIGFRGARPERLFDPVEALGLLRALGGTPPSPPRADPAAHVARAVTQALFGEPRGLAASAAFLLASIALLFTVAGLLSGSHLRALEGARTSGGRPARPVRPRPVGSLDGALARAEAVSLLRDASTPAQLGSLLAVFVLHVLNLGVLPAADAATRDVLAGLQAGLALFLVSALSLRFCYPAVSADGRAALVLRTLPLSPARHLLHRYALRAVPATLAGLILAAASVAVLAPVPPVALSALAVTVLGALSLPALHVGLGALFPRYDAPNAVAVALGPGGLFALVLSTALSLGAAVAVSGELRLLLGSLAGVRLAAWPVMLGWGAAAAALGAVPVALGARSLSRSDLAGG